MDSAKHVKLQRKLRRQEKRQRREDEDRSSRSSLPDMYCHCPNCGIDSKNIIPRITQYPKPERKSKKQRGKRTGPSQPLDSRQQGDRILHVVQQAFALAERRKSVQKDSLKEDPKDSSKVSSNDSKTAGCSTQAAPAPVGRSRSRVGRRRSRLVRLEAIDESLEEGWSDTLTPVGPVSESDSDTSYCGVPLMADSKPAPDTTAAPVVTEECKEERRPSSGKVSIGSKRSSTGSNRLERMMAVDTSCLQGKSESQDKLTSQSS